MCLFFCSSLGWVGCIDGFGKKVRVPYGSKDLQVHPTPGDLRIRIISAVSPRFFVSAP